MGCFFNEARDSFGIRAQPDDTTDVSVSQELHPRAPPAKPGRAGAAAGCCSSLPVYLSVLQSTLKTMNAHKDI